MPTDTAQEQGQTAEPKVRRTIAEQPIHVWRGMKDDQPFIAMIEGFSFVFKAATPVGAQKKAKQFAEAEIARQTAKTKTAKNAAIALLWEAAQ